MNDTELDEMLKRWGAPAVRASWREGLRAQLESKPAGRTFAQRMAGLWPDFGKGAFALATAGVCLFAVSAAFPQVSAIFSWSPPYTVDSEVIRYADDGTATVEKYVTAYADYSGRQSQIVVSVTYPDSLFMTLHSLVFYTVHRVWLAVDADPKAAQGRTRFAAYVSSGCGARERGVIGHGSILNHATVISRNVAVITSSSGPDTVYRFTTWDAPDLGCFRLKSTIEIQRPDGSFRPSEETRALKVTMNR